MCTTFADLSLSIEMVGWIIKPNLQCVGVTGVSIQERCVVACYSLERFDLFEAWQTLWSVHGAEEGPDERVAG